MSSACWHNNARVSVLTQPRLADDIATNILEYLPIADLLSLDSHDTSLIPTSTWLSLSKNFVRPHDDPASAGKKAASELRARERAFVSHWCPFVTPPRPCPTAL